MCQAIEWDLSVTVKSKKAQRLEEKAVKDAQLIENWVGADVWREMVEKSMQGLRYIDEHKDDPDFLTKDVHNLSNQLMGVIIFLNSFPGRCGGWELIRRVDMKRQLARENHENVFKFKKHKTAKFYGASAEMVA